MKHSMNWNEHSALCQQLLNPEYRNIYVNFAKLKQNIKRKKATLRLARQAEEISMERK